MFPYFNESKERYGQYLYNVNTTFYMWYDSWHQARAGTKAAGDREGWPNLPDEEIPSLRKYLQDKTLEDIITRLEYGIGGYLHRSCRKASSYYNYGYCPHLRLGAVIAGLGLLALAFQRRFRFRKREFHIGLFVSLFLIANALSAVWYWSIAGNPRIIQAIFVPIVWTYGIIGNSDWLQSLYIIVVGRRFRLLNIAYGALLIYAIYQTYELSAYRAESLFGG